MASETKQLNPKIFGLILIITGGFGVLSSLQLTMARLTKLADPEAQLGCDFNILIGCSGAMESEVGSAFFGIPNSVLGMAGFMAPIVVGFALLAGAKFAPWFWALFTGGILLSYIWTVWFQYQSIYNLGVLCPWCMVMWASAIPMFWTTIGYSFGSGGIPTTTAITRFSKIFYRYSWLIILFNLLLFILLAQLQLNLFYYIF